MKELNERTERAIPSDRKRIVIIVDWFYPGYKAGGPIQSCVNFVNAFKDEYELFVITSDRDLGEKKSYNGIRSGQWNLYKSQVKVFYAEPSFRYSKLKRLLKVIDPDFIYLNSMYSLRYTIHPLLLMRSGFLKGRVILAPRGMLQQGAMMKGSFKKKFFLYMLRLAGIPGKVLFHATDEQEANDIRAAFPLNGGVKVIPNLPKQDIPERVRVPKNPGSLGMIFVSRVAQKKNLLYFLERLSDLPPNIDLRFDIYGEIDGKDHWDLCEKKIAMLPGNIQVQYHGAVPNEKVAELYRNTHVFVLPTLGENYGHAIFEALISGKPVLISDKTPWQNLEQHKAGFAINLRDHQKFVIAIETFAAMDQQEYDVWSNQAQEYIRNYVRSVDARSRYQQLFYGNMHN